MQITSGAAGFGPAATIYTMSNGVLAAFVQRSGGSYYSISIDGGTTWGPLQAVLNWTATTWVIDATQQGDKIVYLTSPSIYASFHGGSGGSPLTLAAITFNTVTNQFGAVVTTDLSLPSGYSTARVQFGGIRWNAGDSNFYIAAAVLFDLAGTKRDVQMLRCPVSGVVSQIVGNGWNYGSMWGLGMTLSGTNAYIAVGDDSRPFVTLFPISISGAMSLGTPQSIPAIRYQDAPTQTMLVPDGANGVDLVTFNSATGAVYTLNRSSAGTIGATHALATSHPAPTPPAATYDASTGDLTVFYSDVLSSTSALTYAVRRHAGVWQPAKQVDTKTWVASNPIADPTHGVMAMCGAFTIGGSGSIDYIGSPAMAAPDAPLNLLPNGPVNTITPTLSYVYSNPAVGDPQGQRQLMVIRDSDNATMLDTGWVATASTSLLYAGTALSFNASYTFHARTADSLTNSGAGTASPWSTSQFVPSHMPSVDLTAVFFAGTSAVATGFTLTDASVSVSGVYSEADGNPSDQVQTVIYETDGVTVHEAGPIVPMTVADGASLTVPAHVFMTLINTASYKIGIVSRDSVTGRVSPGPLWDFTYVIPPPPAPTGFTLTPQPDLMAIDLAWTNPSGALSGTIIELSKDNGVTWSVAWNSLSISAKRLYPTIDMPIVYRVAAINVVGQGAWATSSPVTVPPMGNLFRVSLQSCDDTSLFVPIGFYDSANTIDNWTTTLVPQQVTPAGQTDSDWIFDEHIEFIAGLEYLFYSFNLTSGARQKPYPLVERLIRMETEEHLLLYRNEMGMERYCRIFATNPKRNNGVSWRVSFALRTVKPPPFPLSS